MIGKQRECEKRGGVTNVHRRYTCKSCKSPPAGSKPQDARCKTGRDNAYNNGNLQQPVIPAISRDRDSWRCDVQMSNNVIRCLPIRVQRVIQYRIQVDIITKSSRNTCKKTTTSSSLIAVSVNRTLESEICMEIESETGRLRVL